MHVYGLYKQKSKDDDDDSDNKEGGLHVPRILIIFKGVQHTTFYVRFTSI